MFTKLKLLFKPKMLILIGAGALVIFVLTTYTKQWGGAVGKKYLDEATPKVKEIKGSFLNSSKYCPSIIKKLSAGIPELEKQGNNLDVLKSHKLIFDCQFAIRKYDDAVKSMSILIKAEPQSPRLHGYKAEALYKGKQFSESLRAAHLASQLEPDNYKWPQLEAKNFVKLKLFKKAEKSYKQAIKIAPFDKQSELVTEYEQVQLMAKELAISQDLSQKETNITEDSGS